MEKDLISMNDSKNWGGMCPPCPSGSVTYVHVYGDKSPVFFETRDHIPISLPLSPTNIVSLVSLQATLASNNCYSA